MRGASSGAVVMTLTTPAGKPASRKTSPISQCVRGQSSDAFITTVLPQASGMASARTPRITGAFQGARPRTTPHGWRMAKANEPGLSDGITSPETWVTMLAASRSMLAAIRQLNPAQSRVPPVSQAIASMNSSARASRQSAARISNARRSCGAHADQAGKAEAATLATCSASSRLAAAARVATRPVTGSMRSNVVAVATDRFSMRSAASSIPLSLPAGRFQPPAFFCVLRDDDAAAHPRGRRFPPSSPSPERHHEIPVWPDRKCMKLANLCNFIGPDSEFAVASPSERHMHAGGLA